MSKITKGNKTKTKLQKEFCALVLSLQWGKHQLSKFEITNFSEKQSQWKRANQTNE